MWSSPNLPVWCGSQEIVRQWLGFACVAAVGCQSYEAQPLDPALHRAAWHGRTLEQFIERLEPLHAAAPTDFDPHDGLTLNEGQLVALVFQPRLRLERLRAERALASSDHAGLWVDPELSLEGLRITESVPDRWVVAAGLSFTIPLSGRLGTERDLADAELRTARSHVLESEWSVRHDVRLAWARWSAAQLRVEETERFILAMDGLVVSSMRLAEAGEVAPTEAALFRVEQAQRQSQLLRLRGELEAAEQALRAELGLAPEAPVTLVPALDVAVSAPVRGADDLAERNPSLARLRLEYEVAEQNLELEVARQYPDLTLGPAYEDDAGQSRIGLLSALPLPLFNANRRAIAEARVDRELARAAFETAYEMLVGRWAAASAQARGLASQQEQMESVLVDLVDGQLADAMQLRELGEGTSLVLLESLKRAYETKLEFIETRLARARARAEVDYLVGPPVPEQTEETL
ncbi:MAG: TolC family protein [bacterium]|nr:TolC family protein [bacterium]